MTSFVQISPRGQITLPARLRKAMGVKSGDPLAISLEGDRIVLSAAVLTPIERYTDEREAEFIDSAKMTPEEIKRARKKWRL